MQEELAPAVVAPTLSRVDLGEQPWGLPRLFSDRLIRSVSTRAGEHGKGGLAPATSPFVGLPATEPTIELAIACMIAVVIRARRWVRRAAIVKGGAFTFDFLVVPLALPFMLGGSWYLFPLIALLVAGVIAVYLIRLAAEETKQAQRREAQTAALYSFTKSLAEASTLDQILDAITLQVLATFSRPVVLLLPGADGLSPHISGAELVLEAQDIAAAALVLESGQEAGCGAGLFPALKIRYRPLKTAQGIVGVLGIAANSSKELLPPGQLQLLDAFMNLASLALMRAELARRAHRVEVLQETDKLQKALLNSVSHNLRTPITSIAGAINSLLEDGALFDAATQRRLLETAQNEAAKLNRLVQNLLDMSRLEGGVIRVKTEPCDVHEVVGAALEQVGESARQRQISITIDPCLPLVPMDQVLIVQVLTNLADNALKYSPVDSPIEIDARLNDGQLEIRVADRGKGIQEQDLERVFEKFFRQASPEGPRGAGLGLSICKGFVNAHGGRIWARCRRRGGTEISFFLPMEGQR
jgi:two-component system sensor histidine kinase KdpD